MKTLFEFGMKHLKALRGRFSGIVGSLLGRQLVMRVLVNVLTWFGIFLLKLTIIGLLSYVGLTIPQFLV